jgi:N-acetylneuraminic acid mutarotase
MFKKQLPLFFILVMGLVQCRDMPDKQDFDWKQLAPIPDADGFAGSYAGVSGGALIVAGGANFPNDKRPWTQGTKTWYDKIFVLDRPDGQWKEIGQLPRSMGYGVSLTYQDAVICIGGGDAQNNYADVFSLRYSNGRILTDTLPSMPMPLINACGAIAADVLYVMGGIRTPTGLTENVFFSLDLDTAVREWHTLEPFPGQTRMLSAAGSFNGKIYVFGGVHLFKEDSTVKRTYLKDCWVYEPGKHWKQVADLPQPLAAAPSPAFTVGHQLVLVGGDDGHLSTRTMELKDEHPGFRSDIISYNTEKDSWISMGNFPANIKADAATLPHASIYAPVTTPLVIWDGQLVIPGGEARPAVRTNKVFMGSLK